MRRGSFTAARAAIAAALVCATGLSLGLLGLNTTSGLIQLLLFACALAGWVAVGQNATDGEPTESEAIVSGVVSGANMTITQVGRRTAVKNAECRGDLHVEQSTHP